MHPCYYQYDFHGIVMRARAAMRVFLCACKRVFACVRACMRAYMLVFACVCARSCACACVRHMCGVFLHVFVCECGWVHGRACVREQKQRAVPIPYVHALRALVGYSPRRLPNLLRPV